MRRDKARLTLPWDSGTTLLQWTIVRLEPHCRRVVVAAGSPGALGKEARADDPSRPEVLDGPGAGPAAGILGAARRFPREPLLVLACDLPLVPDERITQIADRTGSTDVCLPRCSKGHPQTTCALYGEHALSALEVQVADGDHRLRSLLEGSLRVRFLEAGASSEFLNVNRPEDYESLAEITKSRRPTSPHDRR